MLFSATFDGAVAELARAYTVKASHVGPRPGRGAARRDRPHLRRRHRRGQARPPGRAARAATAASRSSSCARSTAPTSSPASSSASTTSRRSRCTATSRRTSASGRWPVRVRERLDTRRHRCCRPRPRRRRHHARDQLRSAAGDNDYVHRVGRTGRAGRSGTGVTLVLPDQQPRRRPARRAPRPRRSSSATRACRSRRGRPVGRAATATADDGASAARRARWSVARRRGVMVVPRQGRRERR